MLYAKAHLESSYPKNRNDQAHHETHKLHMDVTIQEVSRTKVKAQYTLSSQYCIVIPMQTNTETRVRVRCAEFTRVRVLPRGLHTITSHFARFEIVQSKL